MAQVWQFSRMYSYPLAGFDPSFLAPVNSIEHSAVSTQHAVKPSWRAGFDWRIADG
jgi:hypothetical protein